jgi:NTE family protein
MRNLTKLLAHLPEEEIMELIQMGEHATWPKIEMIRLQTKISRTLGRVRADYELQSSPKAAIGKARRA